jgi:hypothetical protein
VLLTRDVASRQVTLLVFNILAILFSFVVMLSMLRCF